jgi:hypothetical protein
MLIRANLEMPGPVLNALPELSSPQPIEGAGKDYYDAYFTSGEAETQ